MNRAVKHELSENIVQPHFSFRLLSIDAHLQRLAQPGRIWKDRSGWNIVHSLRLCHAGDLALEKLFGIFEGFYTNLFTDEAAGDIISRWVDATPDTRQAGLI